MKYKITLTIIIAALLIGGGIFETVYIEKTFMEFEAKLDKIMEDEIYSEDEVTEVGEWWYKRANILEITIPHVQLTEITVTYGELIGAVSNGDDESAGALLNRIKQYTIRIGELYGFNARNVI